MQRAERLVGVMKPMRSPLFQGLVVLLASVWLTACSSGPEKMKPAELAPAAQLVKSQLIWSTQVGASAAALPPLSLQGRVYLAGGDGTVAVVDATSGRDVWRLRLGLPLATGLGSDGQTTAVVTLDNQLIAMADGKESWRVRLNAASYTAPLVAGRRVFVLAADRSVSAFDAGNGPDCGLRLAPGSPWCCANRGCCSPSETRLSQAFPGAWWG